MVNVPESVPADCSNSSPEAVVRRLCALVADKDAAALRALFHPDAVYHNVGTPPTVGQEAIGTVLAGLLGAFDGFDWRIVSIAVDRDVVLTERVDELVKAGRRAAIPVMGTFVVRAGLIESWRDYYDTVLARDLLAGEERPELVPSYA